MDCPFCLPQIEPQIVLRDTHCFTIWTEETPLGSAMVLPRQHRATVFDLTEQEWRSTRALLAEMRALVDAAHRPDGWDVGWDVGWNVGWNVEPVGGRSMPHAHCHLVPRYRDEPMAGGGTRAWIKEPDSRPPSHPPVPRPARLG